MNSKAQALFKSLQQLNAITKAAYNPSIAPVALALWDKHLDLGNPQWKYIKYQSFYYTSQSGTAHVIAMVDKRLPNSGIVGYFACTTAVAGAQVLQQAAEWLKEKHCLHDVYGPINGTLPSDYRLNTSDDYVFPGEPVNPLWHIEAFTLAGFKVFNKYVSGITKNYKLQIKIAVRKPKKDYRHLTVRPFNTADYSKDFKIYHNLRNAIFPFQSIYCPVLSLQERIYNSTGKLDPNYCYFLVDGSVTVGFIMAYAYNNQLIVKTIGLLPDYRGKRLSGQLVKIVHDQAAKDGLQSAIYALIREGNAVYKSKRPGVKVFRKYVTMHKTI